MPTSLFPDLPLPIAIIGLGVSGHGVLELILAAGFHAEDVCTLDAQDNRAQYQDPELLLRERKPKTLVVSPGVPLDQDWIRRFRWGGGRITSELEISRRFLQKERVIGITGSIGKSTVTSLIGAAAQAVDPHSFVGGNLGTPLAVYAKGVLQKSRPRGAWVVLELSSYQLENFINLKADFGVFTYLTPNHLERYSSLNEYYQTKWGLAQQTAKSLVLNRNGGDLQSFVGQRSLPHLPMHWTSREDTPTSLQTCRLLGAYNLDNIALAAKVTELAGWGPAARDALKEFPGLAHRFENLGEHKGVLFINDSKATTMESVRSAVETTDSFAGDRTRWLLLGGHDKNLPWEQLQFLQKRPKWKCLFFGEYGAQAQARIKAEGPQFQKLKTAMEELPQLVRPGDLVLLSPGGTSHDEFQNFEQRGSFFKTEVQRLF